MCVANVMHDGTYSIFNMQCIYSWKHISAFHIYNFYANRIVTPLNVQFKNISNRMDVYRVSALQYCVNVYHYQYKMEQTHTYNLSSRLIRTKTRRLNEQLLVYVILRFCISLPISEYRGNRCICLRICIIYIQIWSYMRALNWITTIVYTHIYVIICIRISSSSHPLLSIGHLHFSSFKIPTIAMTMMTTRYLCCAIIPLYGVIPFYSIHFRSLTYMPHSLVMCVLNERDAYVYAIYSFWLYFNWSTLFIIKKQKKWNKKKHNTHINSECRYLSGFWMYSDS